MDPRQAAMQDTYETLLLSYAAGLLDQAQSLIVASHVALSPTAKEKVHACEAVGGAMMERYCEPVKMKKTSLQNVLTRLDAIEDHEERQEKKEEMYELVFEGISIPLCLKRSLACRTQHVRWHKLRPGVERYELSLECKQSKAQFLKADRGVAAPRMVPQTMELTLVLDGALYDSHGSHRRGDLVIIDEPCKDIGMSCKTKGGFYMVVTSSPTHVSGLHRLLHSLLRN